MPNDPHNLSAVADLTDLVSRVPGGSPILVMLRKLGFWVGHGNTNETAPDFPRNLASLSNEALGNAMGFWQSEMSRATEIAGVLDATRVQAKVALTRARAEATVAYLDGLAEDAKRPAKAELDARIAARTEVVTAEDHLALLESITIAFTAIREAMEGRCKVLSREITRRGDLTRVGVPR